MNVYIFLTILFLTLSLIVYIRIIIQNYVYCAKFLELLRDTYALLEQTLIEVFVSTISFTYLGIVNSL